jgi:hypothetical protein
MKASRFDHLSKLFAQRRLSRREALATSTGIAAASLVTGRAHTSGQDATPVAVPAEPWTGDKTMYLFVQTFQGGTITPTEGQDGRYTVTLEPGTGQTVYFGDRPSRDVGVTETPDFLEGLGFPEDNPPNAALIVETDPGEIDIAVVELFDPMYDPVTQGVTYSVEVLASWEQSLEMEFSEAPTELAALAPSFGTAHLFIDDCPQTTVQCLAHRGGNQFNDHISTVGSFSDVDSCWNYSVCMPCEPYGHVQPDGCATYHYWSQKCNTTLGDCNGACWARFSWPFADAGC